jgi:hypothetical protein
MRDETGGGKCRADWSHRLAGATPREFLPCGDRTEEKADGFVGSASVPSQSSARLGIRGYVGFGSEAVIYTMRGPVQCTSMDMQPSVSGALRPICTLMNEPPPPGAGMDEPRPPLSNGFLAHLVRQTPAIVLERKSLRGSSECRTTWGEQP